LGVLSLVFFSAAQLARGAQNPDSRTPAIAYHLSFDRPSTHLMEVEITAKDVTAPSVEFVMPAWAPGRYAIYDFAKNVQQFESAGANGQPLAWTQTEKETWRVDAANSGGTVQVRYRVFWNNLTGSFSQFDSTHAAVSGASVFMYVAGHKPDPVTLTVAPPSGWKIVSGFSLSLDQTTFRARNYDILVDTPLEIAPHLSIAEFQDHGKAFRVAVHSFDEEDKDISPLVDGLKKIVHTEMSMMPEPDFEHYTFIFHFAPDIPLGDGMEHLNSTSIIVRGSLSSGALEPALETAAHEFFHVWNVKRLRPLGLGPFDYKREVYTKSLWFVEGVTTYYAYVSLLRAGIWDQRTFLGRLAGEILQLANDPGRRLMSAESSSFHAWFYDRSPQMQETNFANTTISYYDKGAILGMLLDLEIRARTDGQKSLDDVLRLLYHKFYESPAATYYEPGRGYTESDILAAVNQISGSDFSDFFSRYVAGTDPPPYEDVLSEAGLKLEESVSPGTPPSLGAFTTPVDTGVKVVVVRPGRGADRAGLSRDDILIDVDNQSLATNSLNDMLGVYPPGARVPFTVERHGQRRLVFVQLDAPAPNLYQIVDLPGASGKQIAIRKAWLAQ
jgi:predicted metalloprotease with PDZ domain